jgi:hypothetical protein
MSWVAEAIPIAISVTHTNVVSLGPEEVATAWAIIASSPIRTPSSAWVASIHWRSEPNRSTIGLHTNLRLLVACRADV